MFARAATFYVLACAVSWGLYALLSLAGRIPVIGTFALYMFGPAIAALVTAAIFDRGHAVRLLALRARPSWWWLLAWVLPVVLCAVALGVTLLFPGAVAQDFVDGIAVSAAASGVTLPPGALDQTPPFAVVLLLAAVAGGLTNTLFAMGEEAGWRGYLWSVLRPLGFWRTAGIVGLAWGLWHAPIIAAGHNYGAAYPGWPWIGIGLMTLFTLGLTPALGLLRERTGSAWPPALFHGTLNAVGGVFALLVTGVSPLLAGIAGVAGILVLAVLTLVIWAATRPVPPAPSIAAG